MVYNMVNTYLLTIANPIIGGDLMGVTKFLPE